MDWSENKIGNDFWRILNFTQKNPSSQYSLSPAVETIDNIIMFLLRRYSELLVSHPLTTKSISSGIIASLGDAVTQQMLHTNTNANERNHSLIRSLKMFAYGTFVLGPILHNWFRFMDHVIPLNASMARREKVKQVLTRVGVEAFTYSPAIISTFYLVNTTVDFFVPDDKTPMYISEMKESGQTLASVLAFRFEKDFLASYSVSLRLWPFVQTVTYYGKCF